MKMKAKISMTEYLWDHLFWGFISAYWYRQLCFRCVPTLSLVISNRIFWGLNIFLTLLRFLLTYRKRRTKKNLWATIAFPGVVYYCISFGKEYGNHEGFDYLLNYPEEERYSASVRRIRDNIFWLQRGFVYTIEGIRVFVMGGAYSMDKAFRMKYQEICGQKIWFEQELPNASEYRRAIENLRANNMEVDYIITHTAPRSIIYRLIGRTPDMHDAELTGFLDWVYHEVKFKKWYFGHFHEDTQVSQQMIACNNAIYALL